MVKKLLLTVLMAAAGGSFVSAQEQEKEPKGSLSGEWRTFFMGTVNKGDLKDFYALGTGGHIGYSYKFSSKWKAGIRLYTTINTNIQDLTIPDETTGRISRYEVGLFDVMDAGNNFFVLPGELFLTYSSGTHSVTAGRMKRKSPLINPEDGRMIPTLLEGIWYDYKPSDSFRLQVAVLDRIAPRGVKKFYGIGESIGTYPSGRNKDGMSSQYAGNTDSDFIALAGLDMKITPSLKLTAWEYYVDNVFNSTFIRPELALNDQVTLAAEWLHQRKAGDGGNPLDSLSYFEDRYANMYGAQIAVKTAGSRFSLGYDYISDDGRFLFPREWGREGTFTFQKRERSEGTQKNHALVLTVDRSFGSENSVIGTVLSIGHVWKPDPTDAERNKYAIPAYTHINLDLSGSFQKLKGFEPELLLTWKIGDDAVTENPNFILNKVDMFQVNAVINYRF